MITRWNLWLFLVVCAAVAPTCMGDEAAGQPSRSNYARPFEPPTKPALIPLPPGAIQPTGWLRDWCLTLRDGYIGQMEEVHVAFKQAWAADYKMTGEKLVWQKGGWPYEGGGYWFEGLVRFAYALGDDRLIKYTVSRFEPVLANMNDKSISFIWWQDRTNPEHVMAVEARTAHDAGWPYWANGLFGRALASYVAATADPRGIKALRHGYDGNPEWVGSGWGFSNGWPAYQAWTWTGDPKVAEALDRTFRGPGDERRKWSFDRYRRMPPPAPKHMQPNDHVVHFFDSTAPWALGYLWTGQREYLDAPLAWHRAVEADCMQPYGIIVADEHYGPTGAFRCTETCDVATHLWSKQLLLSISGEGYLGDQLERALFNAGPPTTSRDAKSHVYMQSPNRMKDRALPPHGQCHYGRTHFPLCCTAALTRIVPSYVTNMWMATYDNGLALVAYGPCKVNALAGAGVPVELTCKTDYPFNETVEIAVQPAKPTDFPLLLRMPGWCKRPSIAVNGAAVPATADAKGFVRIARQWKQGDVIKLAFPMEVQVATGRDVNVKPAAPYATVSYGPLLFALPIPEKDPNTPEAEAKWNYALDSAVKDIVVRRGAMRSAWNWSLDAPLKLEVQGVAFDWQPSAKQPLPGEPVAAGTAERLNLVPYGCTNFRVSMFPVTEKAWAAAGGQSPSATGGK